jgi:hypothetical protein
MMIASRSDGYSRYSHTNSKRSMFQSHAPRGLAPKNYQLLAQEEIFGLKPRSTHEPRPDSKRPLTTCRPLTKSPVIFELTILRQAVFDFRHSPERCPLYTAIPWRLSQTNELIGRVAIALFLCHGRLDRKAGVVVRFNHPRGTSFLARCTLLLEGNSDET